MVAAGFQIGSPLHLTTVGVCLVLAMSVAWSGRNLQPDSTAPARLRLILACASLLAWLINTSFWLLPINFRWEQSLPLQLCNLANLIAALAIWKQPRTAQALLYFWALGLSSCAFLTPALSVGIDSWGFWVFWVYHGVILISVAYVLLVDRFHPTWRDCFKCIAITVSYVLFLALLNRFTGWNYGFVGNTKPINPSLIDSLGPYPIRILWILLLGSFIFVLLTLPWNWRPRHKRDS